MKKNRVCEALEIEKPVIQGAMAFVSTSKLVSAVSNAGGLGVLGIGYAPEKMISNELEATKKLTNKKYAMQVDVTSPRLAELDKYIEEYDVPAVYGGGIKGWNFESIRDYVSKWKKAGRKVILKPSYIKDALTAEKAGADVIVLKGWEGGGHISFESTMVLIAQAKRVLTTPIVASGGIADGRGAAAAIALGADGIEMGTIFLTTPEVNIHPNAKEALLKAGDMSTAETNYSIGPTRQLKNKLTEKTISLEKSESFENAAKKLKGADGITINKGLVEGDTEEGAIMTGQDIGLINTKKSVNEAINSTISDAKKVLEDLQQFNWE